MNTLDISNIKAVAFDIDGTLYRAWRLNIRMCLYFLRHSIFFLKYGLVRNIMHKTPLIPNFRQVQAEYMAKKLKCSPEEAENRLDKIIYVGLEKYFPKIKPCPCSYEFITELKQKGYKIALLSDFPPEQKGEVWGIKQFCDVSLGTEQVGALKPDTNSFIQLAQKLELKPEEILFVGNSHKYDVVGSKNAGMKSAWFIVPRKRFFGKKSKIADFTFWNYNQIYSLFFGEKKK